MECNLSRHHTGFNEDARAMIPPKTIIVAIEQNPIARASCGLVSAEFVVLCHLGGVTVGRKVPLSHNKASLVQEWIRESHKNDFVLFSGSYFDSAPTRL